MPSFSAMRFTTSMQPSKSVSSGNTTAPFATGWISCAREILPRGRKTIAGMPAAAA